MRFRQQRAQAETAPFGLTTISARSRAMAAMSLGGFWPDALYFPAYVVWVICLFAMAGMTVGNLNAIAMEPMGHIAGLAASVILALPTIISTAIAAPLGLAFDGTPGPMALGAFVCVGLALCAMPVLGPRANAGPANSP